MEGAEDIMYLEEEMEQLYKIINKRLYNNDLPVPYFRMHNARYRKKGWNIQYKQNKVCQIDINQKSLDTCRNNSSERRRSLCPLFRCIKRASGSLQE